MSAFLSELGGITGGVASEGLAFAVGFAAGRALTPAGTTIEQDAWNAAQVRRLDAMIAAQVAAENYSSYDSMKTEASYSGYEASRFQRLYDVTVTAPGMGELLTMLRRRTIDEQQWEHGLRKQRLEPQYDAALKDLKNVYIGLGDIATAIVRGAVPAPSWVPVAPPTTTDAVPRFPVTDIDPVALAEKLGYSEDMLRIMTARSGLSLAPILATQANFRGVLSDNDWLLAIAEGDLRTEWAETLKEAARQILTAHDWVELHLRGYIDQQQMYDGAALHGMTPENADNLFHVLGRPLPVHQITTGLARGGVFNPQPGELTDPYEASVHEANLKPSYYDLAIANRYTYPSLFQLNNLVKAGAIAADTAADWATKSGLAPEVVTAMHTFWQGEQAKAGGTTADTHLKSAITSAVTAIRKAYVGGAIDPAQAHTYLNAAESSTTPMQAWDVIRTVEAIKPPAAA